MFTVSLTAVGEDRWGNDQMHLCRCWSALLLILPHSGHLYAQTLLGPAPTINHPVSSFSPSKEPPT